MNASNDALHSTVEAISKKLNREIWIVTAQAEADRGGLVATWVTQASIDRDNPVFIAGIAPNHYTAELIDRTEKVGLHLLHVHQLDFAWNFAIGSGRDRDKLNGLNLVEGDVPLLADALSWMECEVFARLATGDRTFYWLQPKRAHLGDGEPLREADLFGAANEDQRRHLIENRDADVTLQRPLAEAWRAKLGSIDLG